MLKYTEKGGDSVEYSMLEGSVENDLELHGLYASTTRGTSMEPLFRTHRDVVIISKLEGELKKYDVALYRGNKSGKYILHRVVGIKNDVYLIRGDNTFEIERVDKSSVIGVLVEFNREGKHVRVTDRGYRIYSVLWNFIYPIRYLIWIFKRILRKIYRLLFKRKGG